MSRNRRPTPPPLEANDQLVTGVITAAWAIAFCVLLALRGQLHPAERWWIWTCAFGFCAGLFGLWYTPRVKRSRARSAQRRGSGLPADAPAGADAPADEP